MADAPGKKSKTKLAQGAEGEKGKAFVTSTKGNKFVLFIGDEGAILIYIKGNVVQSRQFVPDASPTSLSDLKRALAADTKAPVMVVVDNMDQSYVQQTLPPVSSLSVGKLIKRRLVRDFGANDIKGAIVLGREKSGRKDWNFLMVALEKSPQLTVWLDFVITLPNRVSGIHLVSVESEVLVKGLESAMGFGKKGTGSEWKFFVSHNKVGGFRQVILRNGRIIFTRLAQPLNDSSAEVIAGSIEQEMLSTIEYMKRLSFNPQTGLDVYIIASAGIKSAIDPSKFNATSLNVLTPFEVAQYLGIEGATQPTDQFGDVILAATIGCSKTHVLTLQTAETRRINTYFPADRLPAPGRCRPRRAGCCVTACMSATASGRRCRTWMRSTRKPSSSSGSTLSRAKARKTTSILRPPTMPSTPIWRFRPNASCRSTSSSSSSPYRSCRYGYASSRGRSPRRKKNTQPGAFPTSSPAGYRAGATLTLEFPAVTNDPNLFVIAARKILTEVQSYYQNYDVRFAKLPTGYLETDKKEIDFTGDDNDSGATNTQAGTEPEAQLSIDEIIKNAPPRMLGGIGRPGGMGDARRSERAAAGTIGTHEL